MLLFVTRVCRSAYEQPSIGCASILAQDLRGQQKNRHICKSTGNPITVYEAEDYEELLVSQVLLQPKLEKKIE